MERKGSCSLGAWEKKRMIKPRFIELNTVSKSDLWQRDQTEHSGMVRQQRLLVWAVIGQETDCMRRGGGGTTASSEFP